MDLSTKYLGFRLPHPLMPGACPLGGDLDHVRQLEDAGAAAIVLPSLFEEQIVGEELASYHAFEGPSEAHAEATSYLPEPELFALGTHDYLEHVTRVKAAVNVPVFASLNGSSLSRWTEWARLIEQAGADGLEVNLYELGADPLESAEDVERRLAEVVGAVREAVTIPIAVKLSPFYSSLAHVTRRLEDAGANGFVLFNRFYQSDLDVENLDVVPTLRLSTPGELLLRLRWTAILSNQLAGSIAISGGVHGAVDAVKALMVGAHAVQVVSALLRRGAPVLARIRAELAHWLEEHEYQSLEQLQGSMSYGRGANAKAFERVNYMRVLQGWSPREDAF